MPFVCGIVAFDFGGDCVGRRLAANHRGKNENAFLPAFDEAAKRVPGVYSRNIGGVRFLSGDQHDSRG